MIRFIHTADVHFGVENYGKIDPATGIHTRLLDFERAFNACIDHAIAQHVDFFLFCGDAYKTAYPSPTQQKMLVRSLLRLHAAHIPVVMVVGNHDHPLSFGKANALDILSALPLDGFHVINKPGTIQLTTNHGPINIVGIPWPTRTTIALSTHHQATATTHITDYIASQVSALIEHFATKLDPAIPAVLAGHLTVGTALFSGSEKRAVYGTDPVLLPTQLSIAPFDYIALGHLHRHQQLNPSGQPPVVYAGSIERIDFGERNEEKGFCDVTITAKGQTAFEFVKVPTRPLIQIDVVLDGNNQNHTQQVIAAIQQQPIKDAIIKIVYLVPQDGQDHVDLKAVQAACQEAHYVVSIVPIRKTIHRERRSQAKLDTKVETLLRQYWQQKPEWHDKTEQLVTKTMEIMGELEHAPQQES